MCDDSSCPMRKRCYRSPASGTVPSNLHQAWHSFARDEEGNCGAFLSLRPVREARPRPDADFDETVERVMAQTSASRAMLAQS
jgi:hypothetical protein